MKYAGSGIQGSPFTVNVFDPTLVRLGHIPMGVVGKPVSFEGSNSIFEHYSLLPDKCIVKWNHLRSFKIIKIIWLIIKVI